MLMVKGNGDYTLDLGFEVDDRVRKRNCNSEGERMTCRRLPSTVP